MFNTAEEDVFETEKVENGLDKIDIFQCNLCFESFRSSINLSSHMNEFHKKVKMFRCDNCDSDDWFDCICDNDL